MESDFSFTALFALLILGVPLAVWLLIRADYKFRRELASRMINWKIVILFAVIHGFILLCCFGFAFAEGTRNSDSFSFRLSESIFKILAWPILAPVFLLRQDLSLITNLAFVANSIVWGITGSIVISSIRRIARRRIDSVQNGG